MTTSKTHSFRDRQVRSGHSPEARTLQLEVLKETVISGVKMKVGETFTATRSEARRLMALDSKMFKVSLD
jgi:hypothetical protein